jgi:hypothetical protein
LQNDPSEKAHFRSRQRDVNGQNRGGNRSIVQATIISWRSRLAQEKELAPMSHWFEITRETLLIAWLTAILLGLLGYWRGKKRTANYAYRRYRMAVRVLLQIVSFGAVFSIIGVLQRVNDAGLIADSLKWFLIAMILLLLMAERLLEYCTLPVDAGTSTKDRKTGSAV